MHTFRTNRATPMLAALCLAGFATALSAQQPAAVDQTALKNAGTPNGKAALPTAVAAQANGSAPARERAN
ncbi:MAG TPA: hypothetical protein VMH80_19735 [Bryobacteraceae bacterium]|nr:hypothetical protein [Bryobacteraceae bacterium]